MSSFKIKGLREFQKKIEEVKEKVERVDGQRTLTMDELLTDDFMSKFTNFASFSEMLEKCGFKVESKEDFENIPDKEWDDFIYSNTQFADWQEMQREAASQWINERINL